MKYKDEKILVSIITVCYNASKTIEQTIQSVINQSYPNIEYIIIDGNSTDNTLEIVRKYESKISTIISEPDNGIYDAMNKGIRLAKGELIGMINADDWYEEYAVDAMVNAYLAQTNRESCIFYGMLRIWREEKEYCLRMYHHNFAYEQVIQHPTNFISKALYEKYGTYDLNLTICADYELQTRLRLNGAQFVPVTKIISNFRKGGSSDRMTKKQILEMPLVQLKYGMITQEQYDAIYKKVMGEERRSLICRLFRKIKHVFVQ
jgi:glycosyltransferase involved in cell wall biosynthesis